MFGNLVRHANKARLATRLLALWKLVRHRDTPRAPKLIALFVLAYALSPIDLIPDFIPVIGLLDDVILVPAGSWHNVTNTGEDPLRLYSIYGPAEHEPGTVHLTKAEADAAEHDH